MFKGKGQTTLLSTLYILIPWLLALYRFCFYREDQPEFCTMGGIDVSETFLVYFCINFHTVDERHSRMQGSLCLPLV